jgi:hypothetical protein
MAKPAGVLEFDPEAVVPDLVKAAAARGLLRKADLKAFQVPVPWRQKVLDRLQAEGLEPVKGGVRVPLRAQILELVRERKVVTWPPRGLVRGGTARECRAALLDLARAGQVRLLVRGRAEAVAAPAVAVLEREELRALKQLLPSVQKALRGKPLERTLLRGDVQELLMDLVRPPAPVAAIQPPAGALADRLVREAARLRDPQSGLCPVPALVLTCLGEHTLTAVHEALFQGVRSRRLELRPESGMARLHPAELALCPVGLQNCRLSWARLLPTAP